MLEGTSTGVAIPTRGGIAIINLQVNGSEDERFNSNFSQTFTTREKAKYIQFTLLETTHRDNQNSSLDAFEVALLNTLIINTSAHFSRKYEAKC